MTPDLKSDQEKDERGQPIDLITQFPNGSKRHAGIAGVLKHFRFSKVPDSTNGIASQFAAVAVWMADTIPENADLTIALRDLLSARDNSIRAKL